MQKRQTIIIEIIKKEKINTTNLLTQVNNKLDKPISKITLLRDLDKLINDNLITQIGKGPSTKYELSLGYTIAQDIDIANYFTKDAQERNAKNNFDFAIFDLLEKINIFTKEELDHLENLNQTYQKNIASLPLDIKNREAERLMIELSWKSSRIEGNTYDLLETEFLIKENQEAKGHTKLEAKMILNHKDALNFLESRKIKKISRKIIQEIHYQLTKDMNINNDIRNKPVGITGTIYRPLQKKEEIKKALDKLSTLINIQNNKFAKSILLNMLIAYIQPFNDGNKRTSRLMGNAVLITNNACPLSFRSINELEYKKAIILFYEQNNFSYFKKLFIEQFKFATSNYFQAN